MAAKYYTTTELKQLALDSANVIGLSTSFGLGDSDRAYNFAVGACGYENPDPTDAEYLLKQRFLLQAMEIYFLREVQKKYLLKFDVGDLKLGQVSREVRQMIEDLEGSFNKAKENSATAHLFIDAVEYFGEVAVKPGITDDAIGQYVNPDDIEE